MKIIIYFTSQTKVQQGKKTSKKIMMNNSIKIKILDSKTTISLINPKIMMNSKSISFMKAIINSNQQF